MLETIGATIPRLTLSRENYGNKIPCQLRHKKSKLIPLRIVKDHWRTIALHFIGHDKMPYLLQPTKGKRGTRPRKL